MKLKTAKKNNNATYPTIEAAQIAAKKDLKDWGSNLVYLGCEKLDDAELYINAFNVWD